MGDSLFSIYLLPRSFTSPKPTQLTTNPIALKIILRDHDVVCPPNKRRPRRYQATNVYNGRT
jgi:hypothetical protein